MRWLVASALVLILKRVQGAALGQPGSDEDGVQLAETRTSLESSVLTPLLFEPFEQSVLF